MRSNYAVCCDTPPRAARHRSTTRRRTFPGSSNIRRPRRRIQADRIDWRGFAASGADCARNLLEVQGSFPLRTHRDLRQPYIRGEYGVAQQPHLTPTMSCPRVNPGETLPASNRWRATENSTRLSTSTLAPAVRSAKSCVETWVTNAVAPIWLLVPSAPIRAQGTRPPPAVPSTWVTAPVHSNRSPASAGMVMASAPAADAAAIAPWMVDFTGGKVSGVDCEILCRTAQPRFPSPFNLGL